MDGKLPIVFSTLVKADLSKVIQNAKAMHMDLIQTFVEPLENELGVKSTHTIGRSHNTANTDEYKNRIEAINLSMTHDDGQLHKNLDDADVILVGVSRSGKTPTKPLSADTVWRQGCQLPADSGGFRERQVTERAIAVQAKYFRFDDCPPRSAIGNS